ncbi:MAG: sulfurtransferase, partial [Rhizobiales bacterium]|nr:sulfurtransferase [Hyphomicrobiales bacterium]
GRDAAESFAEAHLPGAVHAPYGGQWRTERDGVVGMMPEVEVIEGYISGLGVSNASTVVIVPAGSGASEFGAAARVYWTFKYLGHDDVAILDGGWNAWLDDSANPVASGAAKIKSAMFIAKPRPEILVSTSEVAGEVGTDAILVDARPEKQYTGAAKHTKADRAGHIPGALNVDQAQFYSTAANRLKPRDEIASLVPAQLKEDDADIISYCNTGHWAATNWFVLSEVLGLKKVRLYDASMVGWTKNKTLPVAASVRP